MNIPVQELKKEELIEKEQEKRREPAWELYKNDPILYLLQGHWHLRTSWIVIGVILLGCTISFGLEALSGGFLHGIQLHYAVRLLLQTFVLFPLTALIYISLPASILKLFENLKATGVVGEPKEGEAVGETYEQVLTRLTDWQNNKLWTISALLLVGVYQIYRFGFIDVVLPNTNPLWLRLPVAVIYSTTVYAVFLSIVRLLIGWIVLNRVFSTFRIHLALWHPDGSAGLGILDGMLVKSALLMLLLGMAVIAVHSSLLSGNPTIFSLTQALALGLLYVGLMPVLIFGWLWLSRKAFIEARDAALRPLGQRLQQELQNILRSQLNEGEKLKTELDRLDEVKRLYELTKEAYPLWPASVMHIRGFLLVIISLSAAIPVVTFIVTIVYSILGFYRLTG